MSTQEVANQLVAFCRQGQNLQAIDQFYHSDIVSVEPQGTPGELTTGFDAVKQKTEQWGQSVQEIHSAEVSDPVVAGDHFSVGMKYDVTFKDQNRMNMEEVAVYQVKDGKIVREQFFYSMG